MGSPGVSCPAAQTIRKYHSKVRGEIERCLNRIKNQDGASLFIRLCMIGRKGENTNPTIMICYANRETSKIFEASVRGSGILDRYPGLHLSSCALPIDASLVPRPLFDKEYRTNGPDSPTSNKIGPRTSNPDACGISGPRMGRRLEFIVSSEAGPCVRHATGGLIVRIGDELYQITSFNPVGATTESSPAPNTPPDLEKCESESQSEWEDSDCEQVFTSEKNLLMKTRTTRDGRPHPLGSKKLHPGEVIRSPPPVIDGGIDHSLMWRDQDLAFTTKYARPIRPNTTPPATRPIAANPRKGSHYDLVKLSELESSEASNVVLGGDGQVPPKIEAHDVAMVGAEPAAVLVITPRGPISGTVLPDVASFRPGGSPRSQTVHAVILSGPIERGDHGSAVIDATTGSCYGHIVLGAEGNVVGYMAPAPDTLADILLSFGRLPSLQLGQRDSTKHSSTVERWKCVNPRGNTKSRPLAPLGKCMSCSSGKLYRERSRAAAHLRRNHFPSEPPPCKDESDRRRSKVRPSLPSAAELKKWTRGITVTPLYARVMQAESDSDSDYDNDVDDTDDDEPEKQPAPSAAEAEDRQANLEVENGELRSHQEEMRHEIGVLEGDIDVLMEDREELKRELEDLRTRLREQEASVSS